MHSRNPGYNDDVWWFIYISVNAGKFPDCLKALIYYTNETDIIEGSLEV